MVLFVRSTLTWISASKANYDADNNDDDDDDDDNNKPGIDLRGKPRGRSCASTQFTQRPAALHVAERNKNDGTCRALVVPRGVVDDVVKDVG